MNRATKVLPGIYLINGSADANGLEYSVARIMGEWVVQDSRGREVSRHLTKADAVGSVEVTA